MSETTAHISDPVLKKGWKHQQKGLAEKALARKYIVSLCQVSETTAHVSDPTYNKMCAMVLLYLGEMSVQSDQCPSINTVAQP